MSTTTQDVLDALAAGSAHLRFIKSDEAWYADAARIDRGLGVVAEWSLGVDADGGGTFGEWTVMFYEFPDHYRAAQLRLFEDGIAAFSAVSGLLAALEASDGDPAALEESLSNLGFQDRTERVSPYLAAQSDALAHRVREDERARFFGDDGDPMGDLR